MNLVGQLAFFSYIHTTNDLHSNMPRMTAASVFFFGGMVEAGAKHQMVTIFRDRLLCNQLYSMMVGF